MKNLITFGLGLLLFPAIPAWTVPSETGPKMLYGYACVAPGSSLPTDRYGNALLAFGGRGEGLLKGGVGIAMDVSYLVPIYFETGFNPGTQLFSPGVVYQFRTTRKTVPFVTSGYTLAFRSEPVNLAHFGGGVNHWFGNRWGLRFEGRGYVGPEYRNSNHVQFRIGFLFR